VVNTHLGGYRARGALLALLIALAGCQTARSASEPEALPSWNNGPSKQAIVAFVDRVTQEGGPDYVPPEQRIATFDNDGTLWSEQPWYFQLQFAMDRVRALAADHPEWKDQQPFKGVLEDDVMSVLQSGEAGLMQLIAATHGDVTAEMFTRAVADWQATAKHPRFDRAYTELVYQPMLELLDYLRDNGFKTYIVSGGGIEFMRPFTMRAYGIPPEQVIGSNMKVVYEDTHLTQLAELEFINDKAGKPVGIHKHIGRRPILAAGNSDGDFEMLEWTTNGKGPRLGLIVHHTDSEREWAYDRKSHIGKLDRGLDEAKKRGWIVIDMKGEWKRVFPTKR